MAFAASMFMRRASSSESLLKLTTTPARCSMAPFHGIASMTSILYAHQSLKLDAPAPCAAISGATL